MKIQAPLAAALLAGLLTLPAAAQSDPQTDHTNPPPSAMSQLDSMARQQSDGALAGATFSPSGGIGGPISPSATSATNPPATPPAAPTPPPAGTLPPEAETLDMGPQGPGAPPSPPAETGAQAPADTSDPTASTRQLFEKVAQQLAPPTNGQGSYASNNNASANGAPSAAGTSPGASGTAPDAALSSDYTYTRNQVEVSLLETVDPNFTAQDSGSSREEGSAVPGRRAFDRQSSGRARTRDFRPAPLTFAPNHVSAD